MLYVDRIQNRGWRYGKSCHLIGDTLEELHAFAIRLGMRREWFQDKPGKPHYDLTEARRTEAVRLGAVELSNREFITKLRELRKQ